MIGWLVGWLDGSTFDTFVIVKNKSSNLKDCPKSIPYICSPRWGNGVIWQGEEKFTKKSRWYQLRTHLLNHALQSSKKGSKEGNKGILESITCDVMWVKVVGWTCDIDVSFCRDSSHIFLDGWHHGSVSWSITSQKDSRNSPGGRHEPPALNLDC